MSALVIEVSGPRPYLEFVMKGAFSTPDKFAHSGILASVTTLNPDFGWDTEARLQALKSLIDQMENWIAARAVFWIAAFDAEQILQQTAQDGLKENPPSGGMKWLFPE